MLFDLSALDLLGLFLTAMFSFLVGRLKRSKSANEQAAERDVQRAKAIIQEFEGIAATLQSAVQQHQQQVVQFKDRVNSASKGKQSTSLDDFSIEAERILSPTLALADQVARAYDKIKQQSNLLVNLQESRIDALTSVGNRRVFDQTLESYESLFNRYGTHFSLAMIDIDHFKEINDTQGHLQGDHVLSQLGILLRDAARETDIVARYGGEEFAILMPETPLVGAGTFCERLRQEIQNKLDITVSVGIASTELDDAASEVHREADRALYHAKQSGRNAVFAWCGDTCEAVEGAEKTLSEGTSEDASDVEPALA